MNDLDRLWDDVPVGTPDLGAAVRGGTRRRRRRQTFVAVAASALLVLGVTGVTALWPRPDAMPSPAPSAPGRTAAAGETATVHYLFEESGFGSAWLLTPRQIEVEDTGSPGYDALHALLTTEPPRGLTEGFNYVLSDPSDPVVDVASVTHVDGVVEVELTGRTYDPYPTMDLCCIPESEAVVQQLVHTVQTALDTDDPVRFNKGSIWFDRVPELVEADPDVVVPSERPVALATFPPSDGHVQPFVGGRVELRQDGCVTLDGAPTVWPDGWTAWRVADRLVLLDADGLVAVRGGDEIVASGGVGRKMEIAGPCLEEGEPAAGILGDVEVDGS